MLSGPGGVLILEEPLCRLTQLDPRHGRMMELRFFRGLSFNVDRAMALAWLRKEHSRCA